MAKINNIKVKTIKAITHCFMQDGIEINKVIGIYSSDRIEEGMNDVKKIMLSNGKTLGVESKDCCNYYMEFESHGQGKEQVYSGDYIINELKM